MPSSWKRMDLPQRIATLALFVLAVIALLAALTGCGRGGESPSSSAALSSHGTAAAPHSEQISSDNDSTNTIQLADLPKQARHTVDLIDAGGPYPYSRDGVVFGNYERHLPKKSRGWYHEYTVPTPGASTRGARRIIVGRDGTLYYTGDHYQTFKKVLR